MKEKLVDGTIRDGIRHGGVDPRLYLRVHLFPRVARGAIRRKERCPRRCGMAVVCIPGGVGPDIRGYGGPGKEPCTPSCRPIGPVSTHVTDDHAASASLSDALRTHLCLSAGRIFRCRAIRTRAVQRRRKRGDGCAPRGYGSRALGGLRPPRFRMIAGWCLG